jgi:hypothetical protein
MLPSLQGAILSVRGQPPQRHQERAHPLPLLDFTHTKSRISSNYTRGWAWYGLDTAPAQLLPWL